MNLLTTKIPAIIFSLAAVFFATSAWSATSIGGAGEISYIKYDIEGDGKNLFSGNSLVQQYSLEFKGTNRVIRNQPNYYKFLVGYSLVDFNTQVSEPMQETTIKESFGKFRYQGDIAYMQSALPITFRAYISDTQAGDPDYMRIPGSIIDNQSIGGGLGLHSSLLTNNPGLPVVLRNRGRSVSSGIRLSYEPGRASTASLRALPRALFEYREDTTKSDGLYLIDSRTRELAVAALNKENNWVHYRLSNYENFLAPADNRTIQQLKLGHVDPYGRRIWSNLTNWINVSADAGFFEERNISSVMLREEYDLNFMAIATRQRWDARTFMNYNRKLTVDDLTETTSVPLYLKGVYGSETDWYVHLAASRGKETHFPARDSDTSYSNTLSIGGTTFKRSEFTLSPSLSLQTSKYFSGSDVYSLNSALETVSTRRFSDKLGLGAKLSGRATDYGSGADSKAWSALLDLNASYRPSGALIYKVRDTIESGSGSSYIEARLIPKEHNNKVGMYFRNYILASAGWTPNARFNASIEGSYDSIKATDLPGSTGISVALRAGYVNQSVSYSIDTKYDRADNGFDAPSLLWRTLAEVRYRPNRYSDSYLRLKYDQEENWGGNNAKTEISQRYTYNFFSKKGVVRNVGALAEEYSYTRNVAISDYNLSSSVQYLLLSGRYSPTDRYSLYGSAKYEKIMPSGAVTMYYNAGMSADFRLLSASVEYTIAKRDIDSRLEKKLAAAVKRTF